MGYTGKLVVIAGIDGSGKETQAGLLIERLQREGRPVASFDFPQYEKTFFGRMVARYLRGELGAPEQVDPHLASVLYAADRWQAREALHAALNDGKTVVCNRYVSANMAHQGGKIPDPQRRRAFYDWVVELEHEVLGLPRPGLSILLDVPVELAAELVERKEARTYLGAERKDLHEKSLSHLRAAREAYREIAATFPHWARIACAPDGKMLPPDEVAAAVWDEVARLL